MKKLMLFFVCASMLTACDLEKEVDIDGAEFREAIYITGRVSREYGVYVYVGKTNDMNDPYGKNSSSIIEDANVYLTSNGEKIAKIPQFKGLQMVGHPDQFYMRIDTFDYDRFGVLVESETMGTAYSTEQVLPPVVEPDSITFKYEGNGKYKVFYHFTPQSSISGYYSITNDYSFWFDTVSRIISTSFDNSYYQNFKKDINEKKGYIEDYFYQSGWGEKSDLFSADFITLSPDMVKHLESLTDYYNSVEDEFFDFVYPVYDNITGGYGFFGSYSVCHKELSLPSQNIYEYW